MGWHITTRLPLWLERLSFCSQIGRTLLEEVLVNVSKSLEEVISEEEGDSEIIMDIQIPSRKIQSLSLTEYAADLERRGTRILTGAQGTFWAEYESHIMIRIPTFYLAPPTPREVRQMLWHGRAAIVNYLLEPDDCHPTNTWLYLCTDQTYALEKLAPEMHRNVRLGLKKLTITQLTGDQLLAHGAPAFCETRRRFGLNDGTPEEFHRRVTARAQL